MRYGILSRQVPDMVDADHVGSYQCLLLSEV
jgi:hypothetical protein